MCIFAYGQTGSGKTHTMSGSDVSALEGRGINYRALDDLFGLAAARASEVTNAIRVQMLEIYNEALRDLLAGANGGGDYQQPGGAAYQMYHSNGVVQFFNMPPRLGPYGPEQAQAPAGPRF